jgi:hypothetical protein
MSGLPGLAGLPSTSIPVVTLPIWLVGAISVLKKVPRTSASVTIRESLLEQPTASGRSTMTAMKPPSSQRTQEIGDQTHRRSRRHHSRSRGVRFARAANCHDSCRGRFGALPRADRDHGCAFLSLGRIDAASVEVLTARVELRKAGRVRCRQPSIHVYNHTNGLLNILSPHGLDGRYRKYLGPT